MANPRPALLPEPFNGDPAGDWKEWVAHFESVATVNKWERDEDKLKWLRVRLTYRRTLEAVTVSVLRLYKNALPRKVGERSTSRNFRQERNAPTKTGLPSETPCGRCLTRPNPDLEDKARESLALNQFLSQIENVQVGFGVKQKRPNSVEEAVAATIELESYLSTPGRSYRSVDAVAPQGAARDLGGEALAQRMVADASDGLRRKLATLNERLQRLESSLGSGKNSTGGRPRQSGRSRRRMVCWNCGQQGHTARVCQNSPAERQGNSRPSVEWAYHGRENQDQ